MPLLNDRAAAAQDLEMDWAARTIAPATVTAAEPHETSDIVDNSFDDQAAAEQALTRSTSKLTIVLIALCLCVAVALLIAAVLVLRDRAHLAQVRIISCP